MAIIASDKGGADFPIAPSGNHPARCFSVVDIGTQNETFKGVASKVRKVIMFFELPTLMHEFKDGGEKEPFVLSKRFTLSVGKKANMRGFLEAWRGKPFTKEEAEGFDVSKLVGAPCLLSVIHKPKASDPIKNSAVINAATRLPSGFVCPPQILKSVVYEIPMGRNDIFGKLQEWVQKEIAKSDEFTLPPPSSDSSPDGPPPVDDGTPEDDLPF